ncbi:hypothetical protein [Aeromonas sp. R1-1]|uniref:DUF6988 family protein n=1 Tax=Aeromonas sp. R1-1 TaxID=3138455 RepID=UPI0034A16838
MIKLESGLNEIKLPRSEKVMIASSYFSICMEHQRSILTLIELKLYGSASSLLRCLFESYVKGLWFQYCALPQDIEKLRKNKFDKKFSALVIDLESSRNSNVTGLSNAKKHIWECLNNYTHSGPAQIAKRISGSNIEPNYTDGFVRDLISFANNYGLLAAGQLALLSNDKSAQQHVLEAAELLLSGGYNEWFKLVGSISR